MTMENVQGAGSAGQAQGESQPPVDTPLTYEALTKALGDLEQRVTSRIQSGDDRVRNEVKRVSQALPVNQPLTGINLDHLDPDVAREVRIALASQQAELNAQLGQQAQRASAEQQFEDDFVNNQKRFLQEIGVKEDDPDIEWDTNNKDYLARMAKFNASVAKVQRKGAGNTQSLIDTALEKAEAEWRKANGLEPKVSPPIGAPAQNQTDTTFIDEWSSGKLPPTKENIAKAQSLLEDNTPLLG